MALLAGAVALGLWPGLTAAAEEAAGRFTDRPAYAAAVLGGAASEAPAAHPAVHLGAAAFWAALSTLLGLALALAALRPDRLPAGPRDRLARAAAPAAAALRRVHAVQIGDSVTWLVVGMAGFGALLVLVTR